ncbi:MAG: TSUP family transporter [Gammaproteobacteria bacterium]|nr:TSUP family transporter [Gammaproteobacteria bacterium]
MLQKPVPPNYILFCEKRWRIAALFLALVTLFSFIWGFYILTHFLNAFDLEDYSITAADGGMAGMAGMVAVAGGTHQDLARLVSPAVITITATPDAPDAPAAMLASGTLITQHGHILTTLHAVTNLDTINVIVETATGSRNYKAEIIKTHAAHNIALLKLITTDRFLHLNLAQTQNLTLPQTAVTFGRDGGAILVRPGTLNNSNTQVQVGTLTMTHLLKSDAKVSWTQNGGPLVNSRAELLGINTIIDEGGQLTAYAVPAHVLIAHFQDVVTLKLGAPEQPTAATASKPAPPVATGLAAAWWGRARDLEKQRNPVDPQLATTQQQLHQQHRDAQQAASSLTPPFAGLNGIGMPIAATATTTAATPVTTAPTKSATNNLNHVGNTGDMVTLLDLEHETGFQIGEYRLDAMIGLSLLALLGGAIGTLIPMGGSIIIVTGMILLFSYGMHLIRPAIYVANLFTYGISAARMLSAGLVMRYTLLPLLPWVVGGVLLGYFIGDHLNEQILSYLLGLFALLMGGAALYEIYGPLKTAAVIITPPTHEREASMGAFLEQTSLENYQQTPLLEKIIMGTPLGLLTGILGVSGGVTEQIYQRKERGISASNATANSVVMVFVASLAAAITSFTHGNVTGAFSWQTPLILATIIIPSAWAGALLAAPYSDKLTLRHKRHLFAVVMLLVMLSLFLGQ